jgi:hypothetical protein
MAVRAQETQIIFAVVVIHTVNVVKMQRDSRPSPLTQTAYSASILSAAGKKSLSKPLRVRVRRIFTKD